MYACPECKAELKANFCFGCGFEVRLVEGVPAFFTGSAVSNRYEEIGRFYDNLYDTMEDAWTKVAARGPEFVKFVASLVMQNQPRRYLDVGCGEGYLLSAVTATEKYGLDISYKALQVAARRSKAMLCLGFAEQLPYPTGYFETISSIGVMTHLIDHTAATAEIYRVLSSGGIYVVGLYLPLPISQRILVKVYEFIYPRPRPLSFMHWAIQKGSQSVRAIPEIQSTHRDAQPIKKYYKAKQVERVFDQAGFVVDELITKRRTPSAPLAGEHFRIYVLKKQ